MRAPLLRPRIEPQFAEPQVNGSATMHRDLFIRCLGKTTWDLWYRMLCRRDRYGTVRDSLGYLARLSGFPKLSTEQVKNSARRLEAAGLIARTNHWHPVGEGRRYVRSRVVYGYSPSPDAVLIPPATLRLVQSVGKHGGDRKSPKFLECGNNRNCRGNCGNTTKIPHIEPIKIPLSIYLRESSRTGSLSEKERRGEAALSLTMAGKAGGEGGPVQSSQDASGTRLSGSGADVPRPTPGLPGLPPFPGASSVPPAVIPNPPLIDPKASDKDLAMTLIRAYRGAVDSRYGGRCMVHASGDITRSKNFKALVDAGKALIDHEIPPAAWAAFSVDTWRKYSHEALAKKPPPVTWAMNAKRINDRRGWFRAESDNYTGGRVIYGNAHQDLIKRYDLMRREARAALADGRPVSEVVERHFPDGMFQRLVDQARREAVENQQRLRHLVQRGEWLWD